MVRTIRSGNVVEKTQFYVGNRRPRADRKKGSSSRAKLDANDRAAIRILARTINCNWHKGDLLITGEFDDNHLPATASAADKIHALFWRRLSRELKKLGVKIRGFWLTADKDSETGGPVRLHFHAVVAADGITVEWDEETGRLLSARVGSRELGEIWDQGSLHVKPLRQQDDYTPLAVYLLRQAAERPDGKHWHPSRGLRKPVLESERVVPCPKVLRAPGGATVHEVGHYDEESGCHYIRYTRRKKTEKIGGHKERRIWEGEQNGIPV